MSTVRRVYVEKKPEFAIKAKDLKHEIKHYLNIQTVTNVRELIRYDVENISDETYEKACKVVFAEPPVDICYQGRFPAYRRCESIFRRIPSGDSLIREPILPYSACSS